MCEYSRSIPVATVEGECGEKRESRAVRQEKGNLLEGNRRVTGP